MAKPWLTSSARLVHQRLVLATGRRLLTSVFLVSSFIFLGGSTPGGCGPTPAGTKGSTSYIDQSCDIRINGKFPPGCADTPPTNPNVPPCGGPGQCPCKLSAEYNGFCGICSAHAPNSCTYCPPGTFCPMDPCDSTCAMQPPVHSCPVNTPVDCGNMTCCPSDYPVCCADHGLCGSSQSACDNANMPQSNNNSSGCGIPPGGCSAAGLTNAQTRTGCCSRSGCLGSCTDDCYSWYEVNGRLYGPCQVSDSVCLQNAARAAVQAGCP